MPSPIQYRLLGYGVALGIHVYTFYDVVARLAVTTRDSRVADFATLQGRFLTIWTFLLQIVYVSVGLSCDIRTLQGHNPRTLYGARETMFAALVWPTSLLVPCLFWPLYLIDPSLVFPPFVDKILSDVNIQVMTTFVPVYAVYELVFLERRERKHTRDLVMLSGYMVAYIFVLVGSYFERGTWIYPILGKIEGTPFFPIFLAAAGALLLFCYYLQWPLTGHFWQQKKKPAKKSGRKNR